MTASAQADTSRSSTPKNDIVCLSPGVDYMLSIPLLDEFRLFLHKGLSLLYSRVSLSYHALDTVVGHLKSHCVGVRFSALQINFLFSYCESKGVALDCKGALTPASGGPPVYGFFISKGFACPSCPFACISQTTFFKHIKTHSARVKKEEAARYSGNIKT